MMKNNICSLVLFVLYVFFGDIVHASFYIIEQERNENETWGQFIQRNREHEICVMQHCMQKICTIQNNVITPCNVENILEFFNDHDLIQYVPEEMAITPEGYRRTYGKAYGVEFVEHGDIEVKTANWISKLLENYGRASFMDIGAGYGQFIMKILEKLENSAGSMENLEIYFNEMNSIQCYFAARVFMERGYSDINFYPKNILALLGYDYFIDKTFDITTCLNVNHFMNKEYLENSLEAIFNITNPEGIHIAVSLSPFYEGKDFFIVDIYEKRLRESGEERYDYSFSVNDIFFASLITPKRYETLFKEVGFCVLESGYFSTDEENKPNEFSYVIGQRPTDS